MSGKHSRSSTKPGLVDTRGWSARPLERDPEAKVRDVIARTLAGADYLSVVADKIEETSTPAVMKLAATAAGDAYRHAGQMLEEGGHTLNAREAFEKAVVCYRRGGAKVREKECRERVRGNWPPNGNIYGE